MRARIAPAALLVTLLLVASASLGEARPEAGPGRADRLDPTESFGDRARQAAAWVKDRLSGFAVTPARLMAGLGLLGVLVTWHKSKRRARWAALTALSWLLLLGGAAAILFRWSALA